jgi:hypothetical protein
VIELDLFNDPQPARRGRPAKVLRQPLAPTSEPRKRSDSWWLTASPESFTKRAEVERQRMAGDVIGRKVPDQINGVYIGLLRPVK